MNKLVIIAILVIAIVGCIPIMPNQPNTTTNETSTEIPAETPETPTETPAETPVETPVETPTETPQEIPADAPRKEVTEGQLVSFPNLKAVDPDGDKITYTFSSPLNEKGQWQTTDGDAGQHLITITASDGTNTVSQQVVIVVNPKNRPPVIELESPVTAKEGETLTINPTIADLEGDNFTVTYAGWMTTNTKQTNYEDAGNHKITITADDGSTKSTKEIIINIENTNRAPELKDIPTLTIKEREKATVKPTAKDPDGDTVTYIYDFPLDDAGNWQTQIGDAGEYEILITATDGVMTSEKIFILTVGAINKAPIIELTSPVITKEGETIQLNPVITDPEGDEFQVTYAGWMTTNTKQTNYEDAGNHKVTITAKDSAGNEAKLEIIVAVEDVNRAPTFGTGSFQ